MLRVPNVDAIDNEVVRELWAQGFLVVEQLVDEAGLALIRDAYHEVMHGPSLAAGDRFLGDITRQVMHPSADHATFADNDALRAGERAARRFFAHNDVAKVYEMLIDKPAGHPHDTPWHQDAAYWGMPALPAGTKVDIQDLQFWVALDDADEANGCMWFCPEVHREPLLEHHVSSGQPTADRRLLAITDVDTLLDAHPPMPCPVPAGGCTIHLPGTPHHTGPNRSDRGRPAYIFNLSTTAVAAIGHATSREQLADNVRQRASAAGPTTA